MKDTNDNTKLNLLKIAWHKFAVEYHFNIPKDLLVRYWRKYWHERGNIKSMVFDISIQKMRENMQHGAHIYQ